MFGWVGIICLPTISVVLVSEGNREPAYFKANDILILLNLSWLPRYSIFQCGLLVFGVTDNRFFNEISRVFIESGCLVGGGTTKHRCVVLGLLWVLKKLRNLASTITVSYTNIRRSTFLKSTAY